MRNNNRFLLKAGISAATVLFCALLIGLVSIISFSPSQISAAPSDFGDAIPAIMCSNGMEATVYAEGLNSPDGLAFSPAGLLHVSQEKAGGVNDGKISQISTNGGVTDLLTGLTNPEGIAFDSAGNLYYVQDDINDGALIKRSPAGVTTTLNSSLVSPEGVAVSADDSVIYVTASDAEKAVEDNPGPEDVSNYKTYLYAIEATAPYTTTVLLEIEPDVTPTSLTSATVEQPSFSGITLGADGKLYIASESSGVEGSRVVNGPFGDTTVTVTSTRSVFVVDPLSPPNPNTTAPAPFIEHLVVPEGLRFQGTGATFPLLIVEEGEAEADQGRLISADNSGNTTVLCDGFKALEDVIVDGSGDIFVTEGSTGRIIKLAQPAVATETPIPTATAIETVTATSTGTITATPTAEPTETPVESPTPEVTATATSTGTITATPTAEPTETPAESPTPEVTQTPQPTETPIGSSTPVPTTQLDDFVFLPLIGR